ncbi:MAG: hypothetical protein KTR32_32675 [Granulosicoccus sp.]|nr:hypothetical protein [Granulosicoccus sp.]
MSEPQGSYRHRWFEDIPVGEFHVFGSYTFTLDAIRAYGDKYAPLPQPGQHDARSTASSGSLQASGWHICGVWMQLMVTYMDRYAKGVHDSRLNGAGIGLNNLRWIKPVFAEDTLTYTYEIVGKPEKVLKNKWGIIRSRNEAFNQHGVLVFSFEIDILAERNPEARSE